MSLFDTYVEAFDREKKQEYPVVEAFEARMGYALDRERMEKAAFPLACPVKKNPPNWQHGRVIYAAVRKYLVIMTGSVTLLDIGTAKGYSALCLLWALTDTAYGVSGSVVSLDKIDPDSREFRNSVADIGGEKTLAEILTDWPEARQIAFLQSTGVDWLRARRERVHVAFVDGKHSHEAVAKEIALLTDLQQSGDLSIFDDVHLPGVWAAVEEAKAYRVEYLEVKPGRKYAIGRRK